MSNSRFLFVGSSIFRSQTHLIATSTAIPIPNSTLRPPKLLNLTSNSLRFHPLYSTSAALDTKFDAGASASAAHPWTEWIAFVDRLKSKGYIMPGKEGEEGDKVDDSGVYKDMRLLDAPCHSFARDRYDIFKSLPKNDIQAIVSNGCPNLNRKPVNSAKRLRAYVGLEEPDVCGSCNLRGSCDRAYVIIKESEAVPRTVDVVRLLLMYALDPLVIGGEEKPPQISLFDDSAKRLLSKLVELSETVPEPPARQPVVNVPKPKERIKSFVDDSQAQNAELKRGDWMCPRCNYLNFARNSRCLKCQEDGPRRVSVPTDELKKGDWLCPECNYENFARNTQCLKCEAKGPKRDLNAEMKKGDWNCPQCGYMNFASNTKCKRCPEPRPQRQLNEGEWECSSCNFLNFKKNIACLKCKGERFTEPSSGYEEQMWRSPR